MFVQAAILSISLSLDAFCIGAAYQIKGVSISWKAKIIIGILVTVMMYGSFLVGNILLSVFDTGIISIVGSCFLLLIGCIFIRNGIFEKGEASCDFDKSKTIDAKEAVVLSLILSADSVSAGCACVVSGLDNLFIPVIIGALHIFFIYFGQRLAQRAGNNYTLSQKSAGVISGVILIVIAIIGLRT